MKHIANWITLRRLNNGLSVVVVVLALYIFLLPFLPELTWWAKHSAPLISKPVTTSVSIHKLPIPQDDRLVIPALDMDEKIYEGQSVYTVNKGVWIRPNASTPSEGSNTVMVGHRFTYTNPRGVFYYLDKLSPGDQIIVYWHGKAYIYEVQSESEVPPTDAGVEAPTPDSRLTLYTCTPLWSLKDRLVITAEFKEQV
ncbi:MAG TPA: class E sortase [Patescibacteria group bacterium]|nr:class E sortase [Patescibacteria group bacterium]